MSTRRAVDKWSTKDQAGKPKAGRGGALPEVKIPSAMSNLEKVLGAHRVRHEASMARSVSKVSRTGLPSPRLTRLTLWGGPGRPYGGLSGLAERNRLPSSGLCSYPRFSTGFGSILGLFGQNRLPNLHQDGLRIDRDAFKRDQLITGVDFHKAVGRAIGQAQGQPLGKTRRKVVDGRDSS